MRWEDKMSIRWFVVVAATIVVGTLVVLQFAYLTTDRASSFSYADSTAPLHHLEATQSSESDERARVEWCGKEWTSFNYSRHDVVLPIDQPNCITRIVIENVVRFWNFRRLIFMINDATHCPSLVALADGIGATNRVHCIARDDVIPGITLKSLERLPAEVRGWIFQQLVKFGAALHLADLSPLFLVWDSDLLPLRPIPLFSYISSLDQPRGTFFAGHMAAHNAKARENYHGMYEVLTGLKLIDPPGGSWIFGWQVWYRPYVEELLHHIAAKAGRDHSEWAQVIIDTIVREAKARPGMIMRNSFSEYDSYGSWVWTRHPQHVDFWHKSDDLWIRYPKPLKKGECCPTYKTLCALTQKYVYVPWENHKFDSCTAKVIHNTQHTLRPPAQPSQ